MSLHFLRVTFLDDQFGGSARREHCDLRISEEGAKKVQIISRLCANGANKDTMTEPVEVCCELLAVMCAAVGACVERMRSLRPANYYSRLHD